MATIPFPRRRLAHLHDLAARVLERRGGDASREMLAGDLLSGFHEVCMQAGLDRVLADLEAAGVPDLTDDARMQATLATRLGNKTEFDPGGPRNAKPRQLTDCLISTLAIELVDEPDRGVTLGDAVRAEISAAMTSAVEAALVMPQIREAIITRARAACDERHHAAFDKMAPNLDERGLRLMKQPKIPVDALHAVQQALATARRALYERAASAAIDRAKAVLERSEPELAARIEAPVTLRTTAREVAVRRTADPRIANGPLPGVVLSLVESLAELLHITWRPVEQIARPYAASQTFVVGDLVEHPKFGRGSVVTVAIQRIEVEFPEGKHTLVHARK